MSKMFEYKLDTSSCIFMYLLLDTVASLVIFSNIAKFVSLVSYLSG